MAAVLLLSVTVLPGFAAAQSAPGGGVGGGAANPFLPPGGGEHGASTQDGLVLTPQLCGAVLARRASLPAGQALPEQVAVIADQCLARARQQSQAALLGQVQQLSAELKAIVAVGRTGDRVLFRNGDGSFAAVIGEATTVNGRELMVGVKGSAIELLVPKAVVKEAGFDVPVVVWRGQITRRPPLAAKGGQTAVTASPPGGPLQLR